MSQLIRKGISSHSRRGYRRLYEKNPGNFVQSQKDFLSYHQEGTFRLPIYALNAQRPLSTCVIGSISPRSSNQEPKIATRAFGLGTCDGANFDTSSDTSKFLRYHPCCGQSLSLLRSTITRSATYRAFSSSFPHDTVVVPNNKRYSQSQQTSFSTSSEPSTGKRNENSINNKLRNNQNYSTSAKIPTPKSSQNSNNSGLLGSIDVAAMYQSVTSFTLTAIKAIVTFIIKLPYNSWYYLTRPEERRAKITEIVEITKKEVNHYWMGTKLLMADVRTARSLVGRTLQGSTLTRRERKQLLRTVSDLFRIVPFSMFLVIPFMEFALPFALRIFPNLLPSTFQDSLKAEENMKRELQSRISMAQFFQETLEELAKEQKRIASKRIKENAEGETDDNDSSKADIASKQKESAASMLEFLDRARRGEMMPPDIIIQYANYFQDDLTLDNMPRMQLINMCKYMSIAPYGSDAFLRFQLRHRIRSLKEDDQRILWEGIDSLTKMELREACQERGMRSTGLSKEAYKRSLQQWLDLSVNKNVPHSLLIMSRSFFLEEEISIPGADDETKSVAGLADAISGLDKEVLNEVILEVATSEEKKSDPDVRAIKLEVLTQQNEKIRQEQAEREAAAKKKESAEKENAEKAEIVESEPEPSSQDDGISNSESISSVDTEPGEETPVKIKVLVPDKDDSQTPGVDDAENVAKEDLDKEKDDLSTEEMEAIAQLLTADPVSKERAELERIKIAIHADDEEKQEVVVLSDDSRDSPELAEILTDNTVTKEATIEVDKEAAAQIKETIIQAAAEADQSTVFTTESGIPQETEVEEDADEIEEPEDPVVARLKQRIESMVEKIEGQLSDVQIKIGDKLHFLDKDMDGILSREEMADCLQQVLKREITFEEAMEIASEMDGNEDGVFTVQELIRWIETNRLLKLEEEGRDADMDRIMEGIEEEGREPDADSVEGRPAKEAKAAEQ